MSLSHVEFQSLKTKSFSPSKLGKKKRISVGWESSRLFTLYSADSDTVLFLLERGAEALPLTQGGLPPIRLMRMRFSRRERSNKREAWGQIAFRSLPLAFKNDEYEVWETISTMDPLTPNRIAFLGLAGVAYRS
ncbi:hypothetical protein M9H77_23655 [Catharanthus roseus]|uniref:Uncharacterized protein n=1 Tax=Catharanthus roseus TaxID=4058 RepID=A0ACC0ATI9_CATRO|nr:hypothetical protein M9H77_23655 [Catharanthus roseus]